MDTIHALSKRLAQTEIALAELREDYEAKELDEWNARKRAEQAEKEIEKEAWRAWDWEKEANKMKHHAFRHMRRADELRELIDTAFQEFSQYGYVKTATAKLMQFALEDNHE